MRSFRGQRVVPLAALVLTACLVFAPPASAKQPKLKAKEQCEVIGGELSAGITFIGKGFTPGSLIDVTFSIETGNPDAPGFIDSQVVVADEKGRFRGSISGGPPVIRVIVTADSIFEDESAALTVLRPCERPRNRKL